MADITICDLLTDDLNPTDHLNLKGGIDRIVYVPGGTSHVYTDVSQWNGLGWDEVWHTGATSSRRVGSLSPDLLLWRY